MKSIMDIVQGNKDGTWMTTEILNVVIDERKQMKSIDDIALLNTNRQFVMGQTSQRRVFKDYILSSEVFYVASTLS